MSKCNFTQYVSPNLCIGDSLAAFNNNFANLDQGLCNVPKLVSSPSVRTNNTITPQDNIVTTFQVSKSQSAFGNTDVFYTPQGLENANNLRLSDGTPILASTFLFLSGNDPIVQNASEPMGVICTTLPVRSTPSLTIFWTASGTKDYTLYNTNSANSLKFNGAVTALLSSSVTGALYVGGDFTSVDNKTNNKFCALSLNGGVSSANINYGRTGSVLSNPITAINESLGETGRVNVIREFNGAQGHLLIIGGVFESLTRGNGLLIYNVTTKEAYPFYINGVVNTAEVGSEGEVNGVLGDAVLYVGGEFDFINYGNRSASEVSGLRVYTNGLVKISLTKILAGFPNSSIDKTFAANQANLYDGPAKINDLTVRNIALFIGGLFEIKTNNLLTAKNIAIISPNSERTIDGVKYPQGTQVLTWKPILNGEVFALSHDNTVDIYVGGSFTEYYINSDFYKKPRATNNEPYINNIINFRLISIDDGNLLWIPDYISEWKPSFNGTVTNILLAGNYVYCLGNFSMVNGSPVNGAAAISRSVGPVPVPATLQQWNCSLSKNPSPINSALISGLSSIIIGGSFSHANGLARQSLARFTEVNQSFTISTQNPIIWQVGAQVYSYEQPLSLDTTTFVSTSAYAGTWGTVNKTQLNLDPSIFRYASEGDLVKIFIKRAKNNDKFPYDAHVLGWKLDFN
jgi:hypothetical protein